MATDTKTVKLAHDQFVIKAIEGLRKEGYKGIHSRNSGFNGAFRKYYGLDAKSEEPITVVNKLASEGKIAIRPAKGGCMMYKIDEYEGSSVDKTLAKMGL
jgi:hypothetical protein